MRIILASQSPRRKELLSFYGFPFEVIPSAADESGVTGSGDFVVKELARLKGQEVAKRNPDALIIASDTLVCVDDEVLGKPGSKEEAKRMLRLLSGRTHTVFTGLYLRTETGEEMLGVDSAQVHFLPLPEDWIEAYIATGEPMDKAGAYAIQGRSSVFIDRLEGSPFTVIGLPLSLLTGFLQRAGVPILPNNH